MISPAAVENPPAGIAVMVFSIAVTIGPRRFISAMSCGAPASVAISADELHYRSDLVLNLSVIAALVLSSAFDFAVARSAIRRRDRRLDRLFAVRLARLSLFQLMDHELPDEEREKIRAIAQSHPEVIAAHDLRTRVAGPTAFIQIHLEMDGGMSLVRAHQISDEVESQLRSAYPNAEVIIHQDPEGIEEPRSNFPRRVGAR